MSRKPVRTTVVMTLVALFILGLVTGNTISAMTLDSNWTLTQDEVISGDLLISSGTINVNGWSLTVEGSLTQSGGDLVVGGGTVHIVGNYTLTNRSGYLTMTDPDDYVLVEGDFSTQSTNHNGRLTAGLMEVKGNFTQLRNTYFMGGPRDNFRATADHRVKLTGTAIQEVSFQNPGSQFSCFANLELDNNAGVSFLTPVRVTESVTFTSTDFSGELSPTGTARVIGDTWPGNITIYENWSMPHDLLVTGDMVQNSGILDFNGKNLSIAENLNFSGGLLQMEGQMLTVSGNLTHSEGDLILGGGTVQIGGNYTLTNRSGYLTMTDPDDYVLVEGDFSTQSANHSGRLTAGLLEVKGNFTQLRNTYYMAGPRDNFRATADHRVKLSGTASQEVSFQNPGSQLSCFANLELDNAAGVLFLTPVRVTESVTFTSTDFSGELSPTGTARVIGDTWPGDITIYEDWSMPHDLQVTGKLAHNSGTLDFNGNNLSVTGNHTFSNGVLQIDGQVLTVAGNLTQSGGDLVVGGGTVHICGNYTLTNRSGYLTMTDPDDYVLVQGDFFTQSMNHSDRLTAGLLEIKGNFTQRRNSYYASLFRDNFRATEDHRVKFSGDTIQEIDFQNPASNYSCFANLEIDNAAGVKLLTLAPVTEGITFTTKSVINSEHLYPALRAAITGELWPFDLYTYEDWTLQHDVNVEGLHIQVRGTIDYNGYNIYHFYTVTYDGNSSTGGTVPIDQDSPYKGGTEVSVLDNTGNLVKHGYGFAGWNTEADGSGITYNVGDKFSITENVVIYAKWVQQHTVLFRDYDGEILATETVFHGANANPPTDPTRVGYSFIGWDGDYTNVTEDTVLTALYSLNQYTVDFDSNGGSDIDSIRVYFGELVAKPAGPLRKGYEFVGWYKSLSFTDAWDFTVDTMPAQNITLFAKWDQLQYTVSFRDYDGEILATETVFHGAAANPPADPTREGYTFTGWNGDYTSITEDTVLTALYSLNQYTVGFDSNGGSCIESIRVYFGELVTKPADPLREGYEFGGWYKSLAFADAWDFEVDTMPAQNITLFAKWEAATVDDEPRIEYHPLDDNSGITVLGLEQHVVIPEISEQGIAEIRLTLKIDSPEDNKEHLALLSKAKSYLDNQDYVLHKAFDIYILKTIIRNDGTKVEDRVSNNDISDRLTLRIPIPQDLVDKVISIVYINGEGNVDFLDYNLVVVGDNSYLEFETDHFSLYGITELVIQDEPDGKLPGTGVNIGIYILLGAVLIGSGAIIYFKVKKNA